MAANWGTEEEEEAPIPKYYNPSHRARPTKALHGMGSSFIIKLGGAGDRFGD